MAKNLAELAVPSHSAVIVVDMQNTFIHNDGILGKNGHDVSLMQTMAPRLQAFLTAARTVPDLSIVFIQTLTDEWTAKPSKGGKASYLKPGDWLADFYHVAPEPDEPVVHKTRMGAFTGTPLDAVLRNRGITSLVMTGVGTNVCVESTAREGFMRDYDIVFLSDCTATTTVEDHEATLRNMRNWFGTVASSGELLEAWAMHRKAGAAK